MKLLAGFIAIGLLAFVVACGGGESSGKNSSCSYDLINGAWPTCYITNQSRQTNFSFDSITLSGDGSSVSYVFSQAGYGTSTGTASFTNNTFIYNATDDEYSEIVKFSLVDNCNMTVLDTFQQTSTSEILYFTGACTR